jgi:hypothetical protein
VMLKPIAMPPKYGTGSFCVLRSKFGESIAPILIARKRIGAVISPLNIKAAKPRTRNSTLLILTA